MHWKMLYFISNSINCTNYSRTKINLVMRHEAFFRANFRQSEIRKFVKFAHIWNKLYRVFVAKLQHTVPRWKNVTCIVWNKQAKSAYWYRFINLLCPLFFSPISFLLKSVVINKKKTYYRFLPLCQISCHYVSFQKVFGQDVFNAHEFECTHTYIGIYLLKMT